MPENTQPIPFGVGCLYFVPVGPAPETGQSARYRELVLKALEAIPNANNIVVEGGEDPDPVLVPLQGGWPSLDASAYGAYPSGLHLEFDLYIPARFQEQILGPLGRDICSELLHVTLVHGEMPLMLVNASGGGRPETGSSYIILVREYLRRELDASVVGLSFLGPSPFHSDFFLQLAQEQDRPLVVERKKAAHGYSLHVCRYASAKQDYSMQEALRDVLGQLSPELATFYRACHFRMLRIRAWGAIEQPVRRSLLGDGGRRWRDALLGRLSRSRSIGLVTERLIGFEMDGLFGREALKELLDHTYSVPGRAYLRDEVESAVKDVGEYPVDEMHRLIGFREERRARRVELIVVLIAAVVGGIAGGIAAWLLGTGGPP